MTYQLLLLLLLPVLLIPLPPPALSLCTLSSRRLLPLDVLLCEYLSPGLFRRVLLFPLTKQQFYVVLLAM